MNHAVEGKQIFNAALWETVNALPLPINLHATGVKTMQKGESYSRSGLLSPFAEVHWCVSGMGEVELYGRKYQLRENDVFYYLSGEDHRLTAYSGGWTLRWLCFKGKFADAIMMSYGYPRHQHAATGYPKELFAEIEQLSSRTDPLSIRRSCPLILEVLARMGEQFTRGVHSGKTAQQCIEFIAGNLSNPQLGLPYLAEMLGVSSATLSRYFKTETGMSPGRYILNRRMHQAMSLLRGTDLPVGEIAAQCGFSCPKTFSRFVRRCCGYSPAGLRKQERIPGRISLPE